MKLLIILAALLTGCSTIPRQAPAPSHVQTTDELVSEVREDIVKGLTRGMTREEVKTLIGPLPYTQSEMISAFGKQERWALGGITTYLWFQDGRLDSWQILR